MNKKELYDGLKEYMYELLRENDLEEESICIVAKGLSPRSNWNNRAKRLSYFNWERNNAISRV